MSASSMVGIRGLPDESRPLGWVVVERSVIEADPRLLQHESTKTCVEWLVGSTGDATVWCEERA